MPGNDYNNYADPQASSSATDPQASTPPQSPRTAA